MKKQLTPEQQAQREQRRAQFKSLWKQVAAMPDEQRVQLANKYGFRTVEGHELSLVNTMLIAMQLPQASVLGGFRQWLKQGRAVMKGQHGAMIWVPIGVKGESSELVPANDNAEPAEKHFIIGTVFDISQTQEIEVQQAA